MVVIIQMPAQASLHLDDVGYIEGSERADSSENLLDENAASLNKKCRDVARNLFCGEDCFGRSSCITNRSSYCPCVKRQWEQFSETRVGAFFHDKGLHLLGFGVAACVGIYAKHLYDAGPTNIQWQIDLGYGVICLTHGYMAVKKCRQKRRLITTLHGTCTALAMYYPIAQQVGTLHAGWHHMSYALACMLTEYKAVGLFGAIMAGDELVYYDELHIFGGEMGKRGLDNYFEDHFQVILGGLCLATIGEMLFTHCRSQRMASSQTILEESLSASTTTVIDSTIELTELGELSAIV
ncbi:MAG: hypothetical protein ACI9S8_003288 [Chlamydiales bacterium]|jgi:hypothetical protein